MVISDSTSREPAARPPRRRLNALLLALVLAAGIFLGRYIVPVGNSDLGPLKYVTVNNGERELIFPTFWEAKDQLENKFIGNVNDEDLFYGAIKGMVAAADDPYTVFSNPSDTAQFEETIEGSFSGVGIEIGVRQSLVTVIAPLPGSPAEQAGVRTGDVIVAIDKKPIASDSTLDQVVQSIRGQRGTNVVLTVVHKDERETVDITVRRDTIAVESVKLSIEEGIAHLTITSFNSDTASRFTSAAREIQEKGVRGIILDVRGNPGGFLQSAVDIASRFLPAGTVVVSERGQETTDYQAKGATLLEGIPMVILMNEGSASASEILAGALHDRGNAALIGHKTFGKGSVQEFIKLSDGSSLRVTVAKWFTPNDININENGIEPNIAVDDNPDTPEDEQLQRAREEIAKLLPPT
jgi:carboxyl-terminal processing protease